MTDRTNGMDEETRDALAWLARIIRDELAGMRSRVEDLEQRIGLLELDQ